MQHGWDHLMMVTRDAELLAFVQRLLACNAADRSTVT